MKRWSKVGIIPALVLALLAAGGCDDEQDSSASAAGLVVVSSDWKPTSVSYEHGFQDVWGSSASDVFAVGFNGDAESGTILRYDGAGWSEWIIDSGSFEDAFLGVWGSSGSDVFAVGTRGAIVHYDGSTWSRMESGTTYDLRDVWGSSASDVFAVGHSPTFFSEDQPDVYNCVILHYDGSTWSEMESGFTDTGINGFLGVWGSSASDVFAVGVAYGDAEQPSGAGVILHYDGSAWNRMENSFTEPCDIVKPKRVWGSSSSDVFAVGDCWQADSHEHQRGVVLHYDGSAWSQVESGTAWELGDVWGSSASDVFALGRADILHYDGSNWSEMEYGATGYLYGIWGSSASDVFAVGDAGTIVHYDGSAWSQMGYSIT